MPPDAVATDQPAEKNGADFGLDTEEQAAFDAMRAEPRPAGDAGFVAAEAGEASVEPAPAKDAKWLSQTLHILNTTAKDAPVETVPAVAAEGTTAEAASLQTDDDDEGDDDAPRDIDGNKIQKRIGWTKFVNLQKELRAKSAALDAEHEKATKSAETQARLDERLRLINEALTPAAEVMPQQQDDDPEPDPESDIFGHNAWLKRQLVKQGTTFEERLNQIETGRQAETSEQQLASTYMDDAARFAQTEPNFGPAYSYLMQVRTAQLASFHFGKDLTDPATPPLTIQEVAKIKSEVAREEKALVSNALKAGKSPAAAVFAMARMTGYRPQAPAASAEVVAPTNGEKPANGNGTAPAALVAGSVAPAKTSVRAEIDKIKSGQDASLSLSRGGGSPAPVLNMEKLANMKEDEFGSLLDNIGRGGLRQAMGG